ncbi:MAG TPA: hypothetical protein VJ810_16610 [Blastocatellia bacterium]|nr:hypothetical protein [Blastocatellia bacterium]
MPDPIVVTISAVPDPNTEDTLIVTTDQSIVFLSLEDDDQVRWVCPDGSVEVNFAPVNNPFDPNASSGGQYATQVNGSIVSGSLDPGQLEPVEALFRIFKYSIQVKSPDGTRAGTLDPRVVGRKKRVYHKVDI